MALKTLLSDKHGLDDDESALIQDTVANLLKEDAIRGEVYENARFMSGASENFSIVDVHNVLDALIASIEGRSE